MDGISEKQILPIKVALLGESGVGKTCILERYTRDVFNEYSDSTKSASFQAKVLRFHEDKTEVQLRIWDTAGQEVYRSLAPFYYKDADAVVLVYDITRMESYTALNYWIEEIKKHAPKECLITIVGNKSDCVEEEKVDPTQAKALANQNNAGFFIVSAKENINISNVFTSIIMRKYPGLKEELGYGEDNKMVNEVVTDPKSMNKRNVIKLHEEVYDNDGGKKKGKKCQC